MNEGGSRVIFKLDDYDDDDVNVDNEMLINKLVVVLLQFCIPFFCYINIANLENDLKGFKQFTQSSKCFLSYIFLTLI